MKKRRKIRFPIPLLDSVEVDWKDVEIRLVCRGIDDLWADESGIIFRWGKVYGLDIVHPTWDSGCCECGAHRETIDLIESEQSEIKACAYALAHLTWSRPQRGYLCKECAGAPS